MMKMVDIGISAILGVKIGAKVAICELHMVAIELLLQLLQLNIRTINFSSFVGLHHSEVHFSKELSRSIDLSQSNPNEICARIDEPLGQTKFQRLLKMQL